MKKKKQIEEKVLQILDIREKYSDKNLVQLYDPNYIPIDLKNVHSHLDEIIDKCYRNESFTNDEDRVDYLFKEYGVKIKDDKLL